MKKIQVLKCFNFASHTKAQLHFETKNQRKLQLKRCRRQLISDEMISIWRSFHYRRTDIDHLAACVDLNDFDTSDDGVGCEKKKSQRRRFLLLLLVLRSLDAAADPQFQEIWEEEYEKNHRATAWPYCRSLGRRREENKKFHVHKLAHCVCI